MTLGWMFAHWGIQGRWSIEAATRHLEWFPGAVEHLGCHVPSGITLMLRLVQVPEGSLAMERVRCT